MVTMIQVILVVGAFLVLIFGSFKKTAPTWFVDSGTGEEGADKLAVGFRPVGLIVGILAIIFSIGQIPAGERGVVLQFGGVTDKTLGEGIYFITPFVNTVERMSVQTDIYEAPASAASKDLQTVQTTVALNHHLNPERVNDVYQTLRRDYVVRIIAPAIQESVKSVTALFDAEELITKRPQVKADIEAALTFRLAERGIVLDTLSLTNFEFSASFAASIEAKQVAAQDAIRAENLLIQIRVEAQQNEAQAAGDRLAAIERAEGDRQSAILRAQGEAEAILAVAEARADGNKLLEASLTKQVIDFTLVDRLSDQIRVIVIPSGQDLILSDALLGEPVASAAP